MKRVALEIGWFSAQVLGSPFSVLGSPFSVLGSPFSVLGSPFFILLAGNRKRAAA
jgi:hypothetical protein